MQSHTNERSVAISVKAAKLTARVLAQAMQAFLKKSGKPTQKQGKQSVKSLRKSGADVEDVTIPPDSDLSSFKKVAREFNIDYALQKDKSTDPPNWIVYFKSKDSKNMDLAFKKFSKSVLNKTPITPIAKEMERFKDIAKGVTPAAHAVGKAVGSVGKSAGITPIPPAKGKSKGDIEL